MITDEHGHLLRCHYCRGIFGSLPEHYAEDGPICKDCVAQCHAPAGVAEMGSERFGDRHDEIVH